MVFKNDIFVPVSRIYLCLLLINLKALATTFKTTVNCRSEVGILALFLTLVGIFQMFLLLHDNEGQYPLSS